MVLPGGVSGFYDRGDEPPPVTDVAAFRRHCYEAARQAGGRVKSVTDLYPDGVSRNYAIGVLTFAAGEVAVLLNAHHPFVAFAVTSDGKSALRFQDCPKLAEIFDGFGVYQVMSTAELERRPTPADLCALSDIERKQLAYWEPKRVGDVVFNGWD